jgi:hypothetical protein
VKVSRTTCEVLRAVPDGSRAAEIDNASAAGPIAQWVQISHHDITGKASYSAGTTRTRAMCSDGADHRGAAWKSPWRWLPASARWPVGRGVFFARVVHTILMVVAHVITHEPEKMSFIECD